MSRAEPSGSSRLNLETASILIVDENEASGAVLAQIFMGFGVGSLQRAVTTDEATESLRRTEFDLVMVDSALTGQDGFDFIRTLRTSSDHLNRHTSMIVVSGHTELEKIKKARDCGANFVIAKPLTPRLLLDRVLWASKDRRAFVDVPGYVGPDRRFKSIGPPVGLDGRRSTDLSGEVGAATEPNLSQDDIDSMFQPQKLSL